MGSPHLPPPPLLEPAWYPDPTGRYEARYWDGRKWTSHISHYGATGADPLLRARWDRPWVRFLWRAVLWSAIFGAGFYAVNRYWPTDNRDLDAEQSLIESAVLIAGDLPAQGSWRPSSSSVISPLELQVDSTGEVALVACADFADIIESASDEPRARAQFDAADGLRSVGNVTTIGKNTTLAEDYLELLRADEAGDCLELLWADAQAGPGAAVSSVQLMSEPSFGDEAVWWRLSASDSSGGAFSVDVLVDLIFVRTDRVVSEFLFSGSLEPIGVDVQRNVISVQIARTGELFAVLEREQDERGALADGT